MMLLLSLDPSCRAVGCCLFVEGTPTEAFTLHHVLPETVWHEFLMARPLCLFERVPDEVIIEKPDTWLRDGKNMKAILSVSAVAHVLWAMFDSFRYDGKDCRAYLRSVREIRGTKTKHETDFEAKILYPGIASNEHERDAMYNGLWWWQRRKVEAHMRKVRDSCVT